MVKLLMIIVWVLSVFGCAMQSDMIDLENEVRRMKGILLETQRDVYLLQQKPQQPVEQEQMMAQIRENMEQVGGEARDMMDMLQRNQAEFEARFDLLTTDVQVMQGKLEENNHRLGELSQEIDDYDRALEDLSRRIEIMETKMRETQRGQDKILLPGKDVVGPDSEVRPVRPDTSTAPPVASPAPPSAVSPVTPPATPPSAPLQTQPSPSPPEPPPADIATTAMAPSDMYNQAYKDYMLGNYDLAITGFSGYLRQSPAGNLAPNALYWIGECYYSKGNYRMAVQTFDSVTVDYPKSAKVVSALLKIGYSYEKIGDKEMAAVYFRKVVEQFPYSDEAKLAKVRLTELR